MFDARGAERFGGRWNPPGAPVIYAGEGFALCMLERLVHLGSLTDQPKGDRWVDIAIPDGVAIELAGDVPGWDTPTPQASVAFGTEWLRQGRSAVLLVPSVVTRIDRNVVLNPRHPDFPRIVPSAERPVQWDPRLFGGVR